MIFGAEGFDLIWKKTLETWIKDIYIYVEDLRMNYLWSQILCKFDINYMKYQIMWRVDEKIYLESFPTFINQLRI